MYDFSHIAALLPFLSQVLGSEAEILLCDTQHILRAEHPITERVKPGNLLGDMERSFLEEGTYKTCNSVLNYRALLPSRERLRASTLFLKDGAGQIAGFLTINIRVENLLQFRGLLDTLISGEQGVVSASHARDQTSACAAPSHPPQLFSRYDGVNVGIEDIIQSVTEECLTRFGVPAERLTTSERQQLVQELDKHGVFLVKGSIAEVAQRLSCSEVTIYRYLQQSN